MNEEIDNGGETSPHVPDASKMILSAGKLKEKNCCERSDSGFSECSACSIASSTCLCAGSLFDKNYSISEEKHSDIKEISSDIAQVMLKSKLEEIADAQKHTGSEESVGGPLESEPNGERAVAIETNGGCVALPESNKAPENAYTAKSPDSTRSTSLEKEIAQKYDLNNTIELRKKSLECKSAKNLTIKPNNTHINIIKHSNCTVSLLKEKFGASIQNKTPSKVATVEQKLASQRQQTPAAEKSALSLPSSMKYPSKTSNLDTNPINNKVLSEATNPPMTNKSSINNSKIKSNIVNNTNNNNNNKIQNNLVESNGDRLAASPFVRSPLRLSGRVKAVTERLSSPKTGTSRPTTPTNIQPASNTGGQTAGLSLSKRVSSISPSSTSPIATSVSAQQQNKNFKKVTEFWNR